MPYVGFVVLKSLIFNIILLVVYRKPPLPVVLVMATGKGHAFKGRCAGAH